MSSDNGGSRCRGFDGPIGGTESTRGGSPIVVVEIGDRCIDIRVGYESESDGIRFSGKILVRPRRGFCFRTGGRERFSRDRPHGKTESSVDEIADVVTVSSCLHDVTTILKT